jgi:DNA-binding response OmpR family regulator
MRAHAILEDLGCTPVEAGDTASGLPVLQAALRPGLTVRFITGDAEDAVRNHGLLAPGMAVVTKPFSIEILATQIRALIAETRPDGG